jgi:DNA-binding NtrC family response regulator
MTQPTPNKQHLLLVDDDQRMRELLADVFTGKGYQVTAIADGREALLHLETVAFDTVITDLMMPQVSGTEVLEAAQRRDAQLPVIIITGYGTVDSAIAAMKIGAHDYIQKPFDPEELALIVKRALAHYQLVKQNRDLTARVTILQGSELIGSSAAIQGVKEMIVRLAPLAVSLLICGETGTGKELAARLIHKHSDRAAHNFLAINCGALSENLLESELFGYERGAFTGAVEQKKGLLEAAQGGTLFLDEINSMPLSLQVKLLRVLQDGKFLRVGGTKEISVDLRVISASNIDLKELISKGLFRDDLYYRINGMEIDLPPLRDRREDIAELAYHFLNRYSRKYDKAIGEIAPQALRMLSDATWPGNVRELENVMSRAVIMEPGTAITTTALPSSLGATSLPPAAANLMTLEEMERYMINKALAATNGNRALAAQTLGIDASTLWRKTKRYDL